MLFVWGEGGAAAALESAALEPQVCPLTERTLQQGERAPTGWTPALCACTRTLRMRCAIRPARRPFPSLPCLTCLHPWLTCLPASPGGSMTTLTPHYTRDLPYDYAALVENVCDPSHVPFSHHGVMGNRWGPQGAGGQLAGQAGWSGGRPEGVPLAGVLTLRWQQLLRLAPHPAAPPALSTVHCAGTSRSMGCGTCSARGRWPCAGTPRLARSPSPTARPASSPTPASPSGCAAVATLCISV